MKTKRLISALMVLLFALSVLPAQGLPAYAEEAATAPVVVAATGSDETAEVTTVTVTATSEEGKSTEAVFVIAEDGGHAEVTVNENIAVTGESGEMASVGTLVVATGEDSAADVTVGTGINLNISATGNGGAEGINANAREGAEATVTVENGDIIAANNTGYATGVNATAETGGETTVAVTGDTTAISGADTALGVQAIARGEDGDGTGSEITVTGSVEAISAGEGNSSGVHTEADIGSAAITVTEDVSAYAQTKGNAYGVSTENHNGESSITVEGDIEATTNDGAAYGILAHSISDDASANTASSTVEVGGTVTADAVGAPAYGVYALAVEDGTTSITVGDEITSTADKGTATGITAGAVGGDVEVTVEGNVTADGFDARGIVAGGEGSTAEVTVNGDVTATGVSTAAGILATGGEGSETTIQVEGDVTASSDGDEATAIDAASAENSEITITVGGTVKSDETGISVTAEGGTVNVAVAGDVDAGKTGLIVEGNDSDASIDILVEGTISGAENAVMVDGVTADNMKLTVWKIDYTGETAVIPVKAADETADAKASEAAAAVEESILYIIKLEQPKTGGNVSLDGTTESHGFDTAKEGETVTLKADAGYSIVGAYNGETTKVTLMKDENGDYYVVVPKGGGVYLTVETQQAKQESDEPATTEGDKSSAPSYTFTVTDTLPTNASEQAVVIYIPPVATNKTTAIVKGTAKDESLITAELDQVLKPGTEPVASPEFTATAASEETLAYGTVDFGGIFEEAQETVIEVPVAVSGTVKGIVYTVIFSDGTSTEVECEEDGVLVIPFPKDARDFGYAVQKNEKAEFALRYHRAIDLYTQFGNYADLGFLSYEEQLLVKDFVDGND